MKKRHPEHVVRYTLHTLPADTKTDWKRIDAVTEEELEDNARFDPDAILTDADFWRLAKYMKGVD